MREKEKETEVTVDIGMNGFFFQAEDGIRDPL